MVFSETCDRCNSTHLSDVNISVNCMLRLLGQLEASALKDDLILVVSTFVELHVSTMKNDACVNSREDYGYLTNLCGLICYFGVQQN